MMFDTFVVLAYFRDRSKRPIEIGYEPSYDDAQSFIREWAAIRSHVENVEYFRIERRQYV